MTMTQVQKLREAMRAFLEVAGLPILEAWPAGERKRREAPFILVSLKYFHAGGLGFQHYLGERASPGGGWEEVYGQKVSLRLGLDVYSPRAYGEKGCRELLDGLTGALTGAAPLGLALTELSWGNTGFQKESECFLLPGEALLEGLLYTVTDEAGSFLSFEVRGGITLE